MEKYKPTIGLEIHAELKTETKMFCNSKNDTNEESPNVNICPVCMAHPGTLPVINREAVRQVLRVGLALGSKIADYSEFDRKNYFYPDIPKGYQISQYEFPLVGGGELEGVEITRVHLEEDTARSSHDPKTDATLVDYNRAGVPLMELVTEPVIQSAEEAGKFARELQTLLRYLGASDANMEKGEMRVEANISVSKDKELGTKVEIKNLNSFRAMERAVDYEIKRQIKLLENKNEVIQETRGWDDSKQQTFLQRVKEGSADYRYFPDPDLPKLKLSEIPELYLDKLSASLPELPWQRRKRYLASGIKSQDADMYVKNESIGAFFEEVSNILIDKEKVLLASNYIATDLVKIIRDGEERDTETIREIPISAINFSKLIELILDEKVSSRGGKDVLAEMAISSDDPDKIAKDKGLFQKSDQKELKLLVFKIISENPSVVEDFKLGKAAALQFLVGQGMRATKGSANPKVLQRLFKEKMSE
jgi:aspartyl-tRNA(Asn)/glutamyl-tRNA(Gln) amidotransferase subunit B